MNPITREESLLDGQDLTPITRKEKFIKRIYDKTQEVPTPVTREEWFLNKAAEGSGGDVTIEQLSVTENGTYSEQGKAYSPVIVEVPVPTLITKSITENGTYNASADNAGGYSSVTVAVDGFKKKSIANTPTDIASFNDGTANPMPSLEISIEPQQDLHGYDNPWPAGGGKNKLPFEEKTQTIDGATFTINSDGTVSTSGTPTSNVFFIYYNPNLPAGEYKFFSSANRDKFRAYVYNATTAKTADNNETFTVNEGDSLTVYLHGKVNQSLANQRVTMMICKSTETDSTFAPYSNICPIGGWSGAQITVADDLITPTETHTTSIPFRDSSDNPITVYGGQLNVTTGELTATHIIVDLGTRSYTQSEYGPNTVFYCYIGNCANIPSGQVADALCSCYQITSNDMIYSGIDKRIAITKSSSDPYAVVRIANSDYTDATAFTQSLSNQKLVYPLATPQTYQLTPAQVTTLLGQNNIFADCGQILEGEYFVTL